MYSVGMPSIRSVAKTLLKSLQSLCCYRETIEIIPFENEPCGKKTCLRGFGPGLTLTYCTTSEDSYRLEILD